MNPCVRRLIFCAYVLLVGCAAMARSQLHTYLITFGDSRFCEPDDRFCKPVMVRAESKANALAKINPPDTLKFAVHVWTRAEYEDAAARCLRHPEYLSAEDCKKVFDDVPKGWRR